MTLTVIMGVLFRYVFLSPLGWAEELSRYLMIWTASLAVAVGIHHNEHIGLTFVLDRVKGRVPALLLRFVIDLFVIFFLSVMGWLAIPMVLDSRNQLAQSLPMSMMIPTLAIPVSMGLSLILLAFKTALAFFGGTETAGDKPTIIDI